MRAIEEYIALKEIETLKAANKSLRNENARLKEQLKDESNLSLIAIIFWIITIIVLAVIAIYS